MNKIVSIKDTSAIFLSIVLVTGIVALSSLSFITASALTGPLFTEDNNYESTGYQPEYPGQKSSSYESTKYEMDRHEKPSYRNNNYQQPEYSTYTPDYKPQYSSYGQDTNSYKSKDSSSVSIKKINCNNINVNLNGLGINATGAGIGGSNGGTDGSALEDASLIGNGNGNNDYGETNNYVERNNGFKFVCINNNNNTVVIGEEPIPEPEPLTCEECFTSILNPEELDDLIQATTLPDSLPELCNEFIEGGLQTEQGRAFISEYLFTSGMTALIPVGKINAILDCLEEVYGVDFPRP